MSAAQKPDPASVVRHYYEVVGDLDSSTDELLALLHTVTDGLICDHETFDCYEPFGARGQTA